MPEEPKTDRIYKQPDPVKPKRTVTGRAIKEKTDPAVKQQVEESDFSLLLASRNTLITGLVMAEIVEPPRCRRPRRPYFKAGW